MTMPVTIAARGLSKKFCPNFRRALVYAALDVAGEIVPALSARQRLRKGEFWALQDVSFELRAGEALAVIGHNGAGKSTLLKILYGLLQADAGTARIEGPVVGLIELGTGINPVLTARENIQLLGALHGLSRAAVEAMIPAVLDFGELHAVADVAVQSFSTGMRARLSYAFAARMKPRVLLVDEVLAVGDLAFQRKCISHMQQFLSEGGTLLLVSHAAHHIQAICRRAMLLEKGKVVMIGNEADVVRRYLEIRPPIPAGADGISAASDGLIDILSVSLERRGGGPLRTGAPATLEVRCDADEALTVLAGFSILSQDGFTCITSSFDMAGRTITGRQGLFVCEIASLPIVAGRYLLRIMIGDAVTQQLIPLGGTAASMTIDIEDAADTLSNGQVGMGQILVIDARWPHESQNDCRPAIAEDEQHPAKASS